MDDRKILEEIEKDIKLFLSGNSIDFLDTLKRQKYIIDELRKMKEIITMILNGEKN